jgi:hypothetical protein
MKFKGIAIVALVCVAIGAFAFDASAGATRNPASVLLFPHYNTNIAGGNIAVITITNTCPDEVYIRMVWVDGIDCSPEDNWITLTGYDTITFIDSAVNPQPEQGFMYAYLVDAPGSMNEATTSLDCLIGQEMVFNPVFPTVAVFAINAVGFQAVNVTADGDLHLDGAEFTQAPSTVYFPRFFGQVTGPAGFASFVILINLTGGQFYDAQANVLVYNDFEISWSTTVPFDCYDFVPLTFVSTATTEAWLDASVNDPTEMLGFPAQETGWIDITGDFAFFFTNVIEPASLYAVLIETQGGGVFGGADLPWTVEDPAYTNAMLWSTNPNGT